MCPASCRYGYHVTLPLTALPLACPAPHLPARSGGRRVGRQLGCWRSTIGGDGVAWNDAHSARLPCWREPIYPHCFVCMLYVGPRTVVAAPACLLLVPWTFGSRPANAVTKCDAPAYRRVLVQDAAEATPQQADDMENVRLAPPVHLRAAGVSYCVPIRAAPVTGCSGPSSLGRS